MSNNNNSTTTGIKYEDEEEVKRVVKQYYGEELKTSKDLKTTACTCTETTSTLEAALARIPKIVKDKFYGCGNPCDPVLIQKKGKDLTILDLGSGSGRDVYLAALWASENSKVIGVDMTQEQLDVANASKAEFLKMNPEAAQNIEFRKGVIEDLEAKEGANIEKNSVDLCVSNCVVNLSGDKAAVLKGVLSCLRDGGEFYFSDVYCDRRLTESVRKDPVLLGECLSGALYINDALHLFKSIGFYDPRIMSQSAIEVTDPEIAGVLGAAKFYSITFRLFKLPDSSLDQTGCEDYGQIAILRKPFEGSLTPWQYKFDDHHVFEMNLPVRTCGNTQAMLQETRLASHFEFIGDRSRHFGAFSCGGGGPSSSSSNNAATAASTSSSSASACAGGDCCS